ncbi:MULTISPECIES: hypothetical protein [Empedobacter]|uniref:hypothetical protein n=1 Tax=Empedobacter TaxID=59734 RepID=UPI002575001D|nr:MULTISPECIES: hypothetical protein [Empedobacter]MDM1042119.1 hypothetical protein [Empedobacter brevis]MDM1136006.1 hypothetical protein [Empedobacter sp. R750]
MYEVRQKISNHPVLADLERDVVVYRTADNMDVKQMPISARIEHFKDVEGVRTLLPEFTREVKDWIVSNDYQIKQRDKQNQPVLDEEGNEIKVPAFNAYQALIFQALEPILKQGILNDDSELKRFD